ncbi:MAG: 50S ribosomal protein L18 [Bacteroidota bacterium]
MSGTQERPRLSVFRSNTAIYAQLIDDLNGVTLTNSSSLELEGDKKRPSIEVAKEVGKSLAKKAKEKGFERVIFDRNGYLYHGKVKALADGAREEGLKF